MCRCRKAYQARCTHDHLLRNIKLILPDLPYRQLSGQSHRLGSIVLRFEVLFNLLETEVIQGGMTAPAVVPDSDPLEDG